MHLGDLVQNNDLGLGVVIEEYPPNRVLVKWWQWETPPTTIVTKSIIRNQPEKWFAPSGFGQVKNLSK